VADFSEDGAESSSIIREENFFDRLDNYQLLNEERALCNQQLLTRDCKEQAF
jgi:hypothetical protein